MSCSRTWKEKILWMAIFCWCWVDLEEDFGPYGPLEQNFEILPQDAQWPCSGNHWFVSISHEVIAVTLNILDGRVGQSSRCKAVGGAGERCTEEVPQTLPEYQVTLTRAAKQFKYQKGRNPPQPILLSELITFVKQHDSHIKVAPCIHLPGPHPNIWCGWATSAAASELPRRQLWKWWPVQPLA